jgi:membrane protease YdiL (CAAX protease family)
VDAPCRFVCGNYSSQIKPRKTVQPSRPNWTPVERKAAFILGGIAACESVWVVVNMAGRAARFWRYTGFTAPGLPGAIGWTAGLVLAAAFVAYAARLPSVRQTLVSISMLKLLGVAVAFSASLCEESVFRKLLMNSMSAHGYSVLLQVVASALAFGVVHGIWGIMGGNLRAAVGAIVATGTLGALLACVFLASHRNLAPCVVAHFLIDALAEPGLVLAGLRGEMGRLSRR